MVLPQCSSLPVLKVDGLRARRIIHFCMMMIPLFDWELSNLIAAEKPNFLVILADDLGYSDLGCYGGEIETPNLDALARDGLRLTQFYNTARCWPSRAALLTGYYAQQVRRDAFPGFPNGGRGDRPEWARLLPEVLSQAGYRSYHSGKWHLDGMPIETGFQRSYYLLDQSRFFNPLQHWLDDQKLPAVPKGTDYYSTVAVADHAVECLQEHANKYSNQPFFHYLAFAAPHFPLHALPEDIAKYSKRYEVGWEKIRMDRWQRMKELGLSPATLSRVETEIGPPYDFPEQLKMLGDGEVNRPLSWNDLTPKQKEFQSTKMAIHAAMVDRMDQEIGRVLQQLKSMKAYENTLILFLSDNGASAEIMVRADGHDPQASPGSAATYLCLGPGWSTCCNTPFRRHKTWTHEGGIATPLIAHWPQGISDHGGIRTSPAHMIDIAPTLIELTQTQRFEKWNGRDVPTPPGQSMVPLFGQVKTPEPRTLWWSHEANHAIRVGDWKAVVSGENAPWELYNLAQDRSEESNLAIKHPDKLIELVTEWTQRRNAFYCLSTGLAADQPLPDPKQETNGPAKKRKNN